MLRGFTTSTILAGLTCSQSRLFTVRSRRFSHQLPSNYTLEKQNIVINGMGPTGLAYALETRRNDQSKKLTLVSDREKFTRPQILSLSEAKFDYMKELVGEEKIKTILDAKELRRMIRPSGYRYAIQIKTLEQLFFDTLKTRCSPDNFEVLTIDRRQTSMTLDQRTHTIKLSHPYQIKKFKFLIATDGARHDTFSNGLSPDQVTFNRTQFVNQIHTKHATVCFTFQADFFKEIENAFQKPDAIPTSNELKDLGWKLFSAPELRVFIVNNTVYVGAEFPSDIVPNKENIEKWGKLLLRYSFPRQFVDAMEQNHPIKEFTSFDIHLQEASRHIFAFCPTTFSSDAKSAAYLIGAGDSIKLPHYHTGSGAEAGLDHAQAFGNFLKTSQSPEELVKYSNTINHLLTENRCQIDKFLVGRAERERVARDEAEKPLNRLVS